MPLVERDGALLRYVDGIDEDSVRGRYKVLVVGELQFVRPLLDPVAIDVGRLFLPMQHQPEFEARIGDRDCNPALPSIVDCVRQIGMLVDIEHTPNVVKFPSGCPQTPISSLVFLCTTNEGLWRHSRVSNFETDATAIDAGPNCEILRFRDTAFRQNTDYRPRVARDAPSTQPR